MPLQQLVQYFNDRFEVEHQSNIRPFILENGLVSGIFGPIQISSVFESVRRADDNEKLAGHITQLSVTPYDNSQHSQQPTEIGDLLMHVIYAACRFPITQPIGRTEKLNWRTNHHATSETIKSG